MNKKGKKIKGFGASEMVFNVIDNIGRRLRGEPNPARDDVFRDEFNGIIIDTCKASDTGIWETAIFRNRKSYIVSQYESREEAKKEHIEWVEQLAREPDCELTDIELLEL